MRSQKPFILYYKKLLLPLIKPSVVKLWDSWVQAVVNRDVFHGLCPAVP